MTHADVQAVRQTFIAPPAAAIVRANTTLTFYPGVTRQSDAAPISVTAGQEISSVDFVVRTAPLARITGTVTAGTAGGTPSQGFVSLRAVGLRATTSNFGHMSGRRRSRSI